MLEQIYATLRAIDPSRKTISLFAFLRVSIVLVPSLCSLSNGNLTYSKKEQWIEFKEDEEEALRVLSSMRKVIRMCPG